MYALDALGSPLRRDILLALRNEPMSVGTLAERFPVTRPAISRCSSMDSVRPRSSTSVRSALSIIATAPDGPGTSGMRAPA
jgi:hypothetical protein